MHELTYVKGTDARNYIVRCTCAWAASGTFLETENRGAYHLYQNNPLRWNDPKRFYQSDRTYPPFSNFKGKLP